MKRAAAIIGPTPAFVRWAILQACPFRIPVEDDVPHQVFRQLRSIREVSSGLTEQRIIDGVCIHPELNQDVDSARGFPIDEVLQIFGDAETICQNCSNCPANVSIHGKDRWAGCYGWFFSTERGVDWISEFQSAYRAAPHTFEPLPSARLAWYRIWQQNIWNAESLPILTAILGHVVSANDPYYRIAEFVTAARQCIEHGLTLVSELVPSGYSDGVHWTIEPHCSICRCEMKPASRVCEQCDSHAVAVAKKKRKVLGLRPFMLLKAVYGVAETDALLKRYHARRNDKPTTAE